MLHLESYQNWLKSLKYHIHHSQQRAMLAVNSEMVLLYWKIGQEILQRQQSEGWGAKVIDQLSQDLTAEFPDMKGFSSRNLKYMRKFAQEWTEFEIVQEVLAQLPWYHQIALLDKLSDEQERLWYARKAIENGWSRNMLVHQIEGQLFYRQGIAITNFDKTLPDTQSDLARQAFKAPYIFDFLKMKQ